MNIRKKFSAQFMLVSLFILFIIYTLISGFIFQIKKFNEYKSEISLLNKEISATKKEIEIPTLMRKIWRVYFVMLMITYIIVGVTAIIIIVVQNI